MSSYRPVAGSASSPTGEALSVVGSRAAGMVAFPAADLEVRPRVGSAVRSGAMLAVPAGTPAATGMMMTFCQPVVTGPAVVRGGVVLADGWLPDFVRLGELERHIGDGVIEALVENAIAGGQLMAQQRRRIMSLPFTVRLIVAMTLMPDASYVEAVTRLAGHLADVPWVRGWHVPASKTVTTWRDKLPALLMEELFWAVTGPLADDDAPSAVLLAGLPVCGIDGMLINLADTPRNRAMFGCSGTATKNGYGQAPFPQLQAVVVTARAGRAALGAITGRARAGEQTLLARLIKRRRELFTGRVFCFDRNFRAMRSSRRSSTPAGTWWPASRTSPRPCRPPATAGFPMGRACPA